MNDRLTTRFKNKLAVPESLWTGLIVLAVSGIGSMVLIWRSNEQALLQARIEIASLKKSNESIKAQVFKFEERMRNHAQLGGHPKLDARVDSLKSRIDSVDRYFRESRAELVQIIKELREEIKTMRREVGEDIRTVLKKMDRK